MNTTLLLLALSMGLLSSFHCLGMCGPIALALPVGSDSKIARFIGILTYNLGRAITYALLGLAFGTIATTVKWMGYFKYLSIAAGVIMIAYVLFYSKIEKYTSQFSPIQSFLSRLKSKMGLQLRKKNKAAWFVLGNLNGLLPCGMVYLALISSMATGSSIKSAAFMFIYGIGTFPMMVGIGYFKQLITPVIRTKMRYLVPIMLSIAGLVLIFRGLLINYSDSSDSHSHRFPICETPITSSPQK